MEYVFKCVDELPIECRAVVERFIQSGLISTRSDDKYHLDLLEIIIIIGRLGIV